MFPSAVRSRAAASSSSISVAGLVVVPDENAAQIQLTDPPAGREQVPVKLGFVIDSIQASG